MRTARPHASLYEMRLRVVPPQAEHAEGVQQVPFAILEQGETENMSIVRRGNRSMMICDTCGRRIGEFEWCRAVMRTVPATRSLDTRKDICEMCWERAEAFLKEGKAQDTKLDKAVTSMAGAIEGLERRVGELEKKGAGTPSDGQYFKPHWNTTTTRTTPYDTTGYVPTYSNGTFIPLNTTRSKCALSPSEIRAMRKRQKEEWMAEVARPREEKGDE